MSDVTTINESLIEQVNPCRAIQSRWGRERVRRRLRVIRGFRHLLVREREALCRLVREEIDRPASEVLTSDVIPTTSACRFLEKHAARILRPAKVPRFDRPLWLFGQTDVVHRRPRGVVGIIGTWNYPIFLNAVQIAQALTAGNGVIWKPSEVVPRTSELIYELFLRAGCPHELLVRLPATREAGPALAEAPIDHLIFTGSAEVGRRLATRLGERLVSSTLELSGCDAMFALPDADVALAAKAAWFAVTLNKGQTCLAVRRVFVHRSRYAELLDQLRPLAQAASPVRLVLPRQQEQADELVREALAAGARALVEFPDTPTGEGFRPTILTDATPEMAVCREAYFAPLLAVIPFDSIDEVLHMDAKCPYGLGASIFSASVRPGERLASRLRVGTVAINDVIVSTAHPATPFGGVRDSGWGVTQGAEGLRELTVAQVVSRRSGTFRPHYDFGQMADPNMAVVLEGMLRWNHGGGIRNWWAGLRQMIRGGRAMRRKEE